MFGRRYVESGGWIVVVVVLLEPRIMGCVLVRRLVRHSDPKSPKLNDPAMRLY